MIYTKYNGSGGYVTLSAAENGDPITRIGAKAFLSRKDIYHLTIPDSVTHIDDWAFAHMHNLKELTLPGNHICFGKKVFLDCFELKQIHITNDASGNPGLPFFLAAAITVFADAELLQPAFSASSDTHEKWMHTYDEHLISYLCAADAKGFEPIFYGWFNDEDADTAQLPAYLQKQRENKVYLCFLRLRYDLHLSDAHRKMLYNYLSEHMPWGKKAAEHTAPWDLLPTHYSDDIVYIRILENAGILQTQTIPLLIAHLSEASAEAIAYLLRFQEKNSQFSDFFNNFSL